jgi:hypothetical protein
MQGNKQGIEKNRHSYPDMARADSDEIDAGPLHLSPVGRGRFVMKIRNKRNIIDLCDTT